MPCLYEQERSGAIGMLKAGVRVSDVARYHNYHPPTIQWLRDGYQATGTVKDRRRSGQPRMATGVKSQHDTLVVMGATMGHFFKPEKNFEFFRLKNAP